MKGKIILEYIPGTKGDFLARFLTDQSIKLTELGRSADLEESLKFLSRYKEDVGYYNPSFDNFEKYLSKKFGKVITAHELFFLSNAKQYYSILQKYNMSIVKICYDKQFYKTIQIEDLFKNSKADYADYKERIIKEHYQNQKIDDAFKFSIDFFLLQRNIEINNTNRAELLHNFLSNPITSKLINRQWGLKNEIFNSEKQKQNKNIINYKDLYIDFNLSNPIFDEINTELFPSMVAKTWLPEKIVLFSETWKPKDYGYLNF